MAKKLTAEMWRPVPIAQYACVYSVSSMGRVRRELPARGSRVGQIRKLLMGKRGYVTVSLSCKGHSSTHLVHRLVATAFIGNPHNKPEVNHKDGDRWNNAVCNLEWVTRLENARHSFQELGRQGTSLKGEVNPNAVLTDKSVGIIKRELNRGVRGVVLARRFGVRDTTISNIKKGVRWQHVHALP